VAVNRAISIDALAALSLRDHRDCTYDFSDLARGPLIIVFVRGHWCPYCRRYLCKLQHHIPRFREFGARLVVISPEPQDTSAALVAQLRLTIPILADRNGRAIELFGVRNAFSGTTTLMPHPAVFILTADGELGFRSIDRNYKQRTSMRTILQQLRALIPA